jgi:hypothetical protein
MKIVSRVYNSEEDLESVMTFLSEVFSETGSYQNWFPDRFENNYECSGSEKWAGDIRVWEEIDDEFRSSRKIVALANPESTNDYFIQVSPAYSFLEREILEWIEKHCSGKKKNPNKEEKLRVHTIEGNSIRELLLSDLGYKKEKLHMYLRFRSLDLPVPTVKCPENYEIRSVKGISDYDQLASVTRLVFGHGEWFNAQTYEEITRCSFYKQDLDLVAVAPDGTFASFCTFRMDPTSKITNLEPVGTHPDHRKLDLAKALIFEGLKRVIRYNPALLYVGGANTPAANRLYDSVDYTKKLAEYCWSKEI